MFLISKDYMDIYAGCPAEIPHYINSIDMWLDILLPSNSEDIDSEKKAQGSQRIQVKGHRKLQDNI